MTSREDNDDEMGSRHQHGHRKVFPCIPLLCVILFANYAHSLASFRRIPGTMATRRRRIPHTKNKSFARRKRSPDVQHAKIRLVR